MHPGSWIRVGGCKLTGFQRISNTGVPEYSYLRGLLLAQIPPLVSRIVSEVTILAQCIWKDNVVCNDIITCMDGAPVTECEGPVFRRAMVEKPPDTCGQEVSDPDHVQGTWQELCKMSTDLSMSHFLLSCSSASGPNASCNLSLAPCSE